MRINPQFIPAETNGKPARLINVSRIAYVNFVPLTNCYQVYFDGGDMTIPRQRGWNTPPLASAARLAKSPVRCAVGILAGPRTGMTH